MREHSALDTLLAPGGLTPLYQPVFSIAGPEPALYSFECLTRGPEGTNFESATVLFDYVRLKRQEIAIDRVCIATALEQMPHVKSDIRLSVNAHASTLGRDPSFADFLSAAAAEYDFPLARITVELVEHGPPWDTAAFQLTLRKLRAAGVSIALDDVGLGLSNFKMLLDVHPEFVKIDRYLVDGCHSDAGRRAIIRSLKTVADEFGSKIVAEGIESVEDLEALRSIGVELIQGFLLAKPLKADALAELFVAASAGQRVVAAFAP